MSYRVYTTRGIVLKKKNSGEQNSFLYLLTEDLGLIIASARSTRSFRSKLKGLIEEFSYGDFSLVKGKNGWRLTNVSQEGNFFFEGEDHSKKTIAQISSVIIKMIQGEVEQSDIYNCVHRAFKFLTKCETVNTQLVEIVSVLRIMSLLGYVESGNRVTNLVSGCEIDQNLLNLVSENKIKLVGIINKAIKESHL